MIIKLTPFFLALAGLGGLPACSAPTQSAQASSLAQESPGAGELIQSGRRLLAQRDGAGAEPFFQAALDQEPDSFDARLWLLRSWMDQGRSNDTLDALDELRRGGRNGPRMEYLYGMAFLRRAQAMLGAGVTDSSPRMNLEDAAFRLGKALEAFPSEYPDAYQGLAIAAWFSQDLERARWAGDHAVELSPDSPRAWLQLGRIAMSQFSASRSSQPDEPWSPATRAFHAHALQAFEGAIQTLGQPVDDPQRQRLLADAGIQKGHALIWDARQQEAMHAYALGVAWSPEAVNYPQIQGLLASEAIQAPQLGLFHQALESGYASFERNFGTDDLRNAGMLWWLGWERLAAGRSVASELAFLECVHKNPAFINSWFYAALARIQAHNYAGGADALAMGWKVDSNVMVDSVLADKDKNVWLLSQALNQLAEDTPVPSTKTNRRAAMLARVIAEADPYEGWNWNNLGMFVRDQADAMLFGGELEAGAPELDALYERSYNAYQRSLVLLPEDPGVVNDTAVLLHYYLKREWDQALEMYARATQLAQAALLQEDLSAWEKKRLETALRDSIENHRLLLLLQAEQVNQPTSDESSPS